jgi:hypothetical protein
MENIKMYKLLGVSETTYNFGEQILSSLTKRFEEIDKIANEIICCKTHLLPIDSSDYEHLKEISSSIEAIKIDIPILTYDSIASIEDELTTIDQNTISSGIFFICENNIITMDQLEMLSSLIIKHIDIKN